MPYYGRRYPKKKGNTTTVKKATTTGSRTTRKKATSGIIQVVHTFPTSSQQLVQPIPGTQGINSPVSIEQQNLIRSTYKKCLEQAASSGKFLTSAQRQSLQMAISTEAALQQPGGPVVQPSSGSALLASQSLTTAELVSLLRQKASISESGSRPNLPSSAINT